MNVYFVSGMCVNCKVFDKIDLPDGYSKKYIEWNIPQGSESLLEYVRLLTKDIDTQNPFILIGYSFGGIIIQEMNKFLSPAKNIIISSIKQKNEIPNLFKLAKATHILKILPTKLYSTNKKISNIFAKILYKMDINEVEEYVSYTMPIYMKWSTFQITSWEPQISVPNLFHIHGTKDQIFSSERIKNAYMIEEGDHLMILRKSDEISKILKNIL